MDDTQTPETNPPTLEELLTIPTIRPDVYTHGEWVGFIQNTPTYHFPNPNEITLQQFTEALTTGNHFYAPIIQQYETQLLTNPQTPGSPQTTTVTDEKGEHFFIKFTKNTGTLEMLPAAIKISHTQNEQGQYVIADDYWSVNVTASFHKHKTITNFTENPPRKPRTLLLTITSSNNKLTITNTETN